MITLDLLDTRSNDADSAMLEVFRHFQLRWKNKFSPQEAIKLLPMWRDTIPVAHLEFWLPVAKHLNATWPDGPPPSNIAFRDEVRKYIAKFAPPSVITDPVPEPIVTPATKAKNRLSKRAHEALGTWNLVSDVWSLAFREYKTNDRLADLELGDITDAAWDALVQRVQHNEAEKLAAREAGLEPAVAVP